MESHRRQRRIEMEAEALGPAERIIDTVLTYNGKSEES